jgi:hypothetical protein
MVFLEIFSRSLQFSFSLGQSSDRKNTLSGVSLSSQQLGKWRRRSCKPTRLAFAEDTNNGSTVGCLPQTAQPLLPVTLMLQALATKGQPRNLRSVTCQCSLNFFRKASKKRLHMPMRNTPPCRPLLFLMASPISFRKSLTALSIDLSMGQMSTAFTLGRGAMPTGK